MIRNLIKRAVTWLQPPPVVAPVVEPAPKPAAKPATPEWNPESYLEGWRKGTRCPFCAKEKESGPLMCKPCDDFREPFRKARAAKEKSDAA